MLVKIPFWTNKLVKQILLDWKWAPPIAFPTHSPNLRSWLIHFQFKICVKGEHWMLLSEYAPLIWKHQYWVGKVRLVWGWVKKWAGLKKGEISKGEKWLSPCMYVLHCWLCYLLMASRHRTWLGYLARFVSSTSSDASATEWLIGVSLIDKIFFATRNISPSQKYSHTKI